ncbi:Uncharacterized protein MLTONO_2556 [Mesorhizobium loti]|nr:Uncharacterized protein MLTONO_2556 [Mesorhizobium loti]
MTQRRIDKERIERADRESKLAIEAERVARIAKTECLRAQRLSGGTTRRKLGSGQASSTSREEASPKGYRRRVRRNLTLHVSIFDKPHWRTILTTKDDGEAKALEQAMYQDGAKTQVEEMEGNARGWGSGRKCGRQGSAKAWKSGRAWTWPPPTAPFAQSRSYLAQRTYATLLEALNGHCVPPAECSRVRTLDTPRRR